MDFCAPPSLACARSNFIAFDAITLIIFNVVLLSFRFVSLSHNYHSLFLFFLFLQV